MENISIKCVAFSSHIKHSQLEQLRFIIPTMVLFSQTHFVYQENVYNKLLSQGEKKQKNNITPITKTILWLFYGSTSARMLLNKMLQQFCNRFFQVYSGWDYFSLVNSFFLSCLNCSLHTQQCN